MQIDLVAPVDFDAGITGKDLAMVQLELFGVHEQRYEKQASDFLARHRLVIQVRDSVILYDLDEDSIWAQISHDGGSEWDQRMATRIDADPETNLFRLKHLFAQSEARLILEV